jgi:hypothetical protein
LSSSFSEIEGRPPTCLQRTSSECKSFMLMSNHPHFPY